MFKKGNRQDLVEKEEAEIAVIERFLPKQMDEAAVAAAVAEAVASTGAKTVKDMGGVMAVLKNCRNTFPNHYIRIMAFDATRGVESIAMSFIVNRPPSEPGFGLVRQEVEGRRVHYTVHSYATDRPETQRYEG